MSDTTSIKHKRPNFVKFSGESTMAKPTDKTENTFPKKDDEILDAVKEASSKIKEEAMSTKDTSADPKGTEESPKDETKKEKEVHYPATVTELNDQAREALDAVLDSVQHKIASENLSDETPEKALKEAQISTAMKELAPRVFSSDEAKLAIINMPAEELTERLAKITEQTSACCSSLEVLTRTVELKLQTLNYLLEETDFDFNKVAGYMSDTELTSVGNRYGLKFIHG